METYQDLTRAFASALKAKTSGKLYIERFLPWPELESRLRNRVTLVGDPSEYPYTEAVMIPKRVAISELRPISKYILRAHIQQQELFYNELLHKYKLSMFDLTGILEYQLKKTAMDDEVIDRANSAMIFHMAPPIVERYYEPAEASEVSAIVDGLHRVSLARMLQLTHIWIIEISHVDEKYPLLALPVSWDDVIPTDTVPPQNEKRLFRYPSFEDFQRDIPHIHTSLATRENYMYYFYRDLSTLGSGGIRLAQ
jgi:hypothetical protein